MLSSWLRPILVAVAVGSLAITTAILVRPQPKVSPTLAAQTSWSADIQPDLSDPLRVVVNSEVFRETAWRNFQRVVHGCMIGADVYTFQESDPPVLDPLPVEPRVFAGSTRLSYGLTASVTDPTRSALTVQTLGLTATEGRNYLRWLRGSVPEGLTSWDLRAYDGVSSEKFGTSAEETGGCEAIGRRLVTEPAVAAMVRLQPKLDEFRTDQVMNPKLEDLDAAWSNCMTGRGFAYGSITEPAFALFQERPSLSSVAWSAFREKELSVASAAKTCFDSSGLSAYNDGELASAWQAFVDNNLGDLLLAAGMTGASGMGAV